MLEGNTVEKFSLGILLYSIDSLIALLQFWGRVGRGPSSMYSHYPACHMILSQSVMEQIAKGRQGTLHWQQHETLATSLFSNSLEATVRAKTVLGFDAVLSFVQEVKEKCVFLALNGRFVDVPLNERLCVCGCSYCGDVS